MLEGKLIQLRVRGRVRVTDQDAHTAYQRYLVEIEKQHPVDLRILAKRIPAGLERGPGAAAHTPRQLARERGAQARRGLLRARREVQRRRADEEDVRLAWSPARWRARSRASGRDRRTEGGRRDGAYPGRHRRRPDRPGRPRSHAHLRRGQGRDVEPRVRRGDGAPAQAVARRAASRRLRRPRVCSRARPRQDALPLLRHVPLREVPDRVAEPVERQREHREHLC